MPVQDLGVPSAAAPPAPAPAPGAGRGRAAGAARARRSAAVRRTGLALYPLGLAGLDAAAAGLGAWTLAPQAVAAAAATTAAAVLVGAQAVAGGYRPCRTRSIVDEAFSLAARTALAVLVPVAATLPGRSAPDPVPAAGVVLGCVAAVLLGRAAAHRLVGLYRRARPHGRRTLVVGGGPATDHVIEALAERPALGLAVAGRIAAADRPAPGTVPAPAPEPADAPVLGRLPDLRAVIDAERARTVVVVMEDVPGRHGDTAVRACPPGTEVLVLPAPAGLAASPGRAPGYLAGLPCTRLAVRGHRSPARLAKRAFDLAAALLIVPVLLPVLLACAVAVRLESGPGVLFRQRRIGLEGRPFVLLKFRTLRPSDDREADTRWSVAGDHRMGPVGRFLRKTSLDELPQLWNIVRGDMSLVGPRPERPHFVQQFTGAHPGYPLRHRAPVGLTGWSQVHGLRGDTSIERRTRLDNHYIDGWTFSGDLRILLMTVREILGGGGR
ncbi:sugar transferase [Actinomadura parmotrematis]|uniref:Sugar transferase n=1 Tax=Actinomadura parmotrematis TaxID=2864039 RepID=A0ABS7G2J6_9ACTN|nr:sugar transferase [Actinomadura parmotrematis]MBW8486902.1 sugar transferase [Actinomadura parmotrematis]